MKTKLLSISILMLVLFGLFVFSASALPIEVTNPIPANGGTDITPDASLSITSTVNSSNGSSMMGRCWTNASGSFVWSNWVGPFDNTTINWQINASEYDTKYWWGVSANDSWGNSLNQTWNFTTAAAPVTPTSPSTHLRDTPGLGDTEKAIIGIIAFIVVLFVMYQCYLMFTTKKITPESVVYVLVAVIVLGVMMAFI